ncbi:HD domain-containing protein [Crenobacter luteus]|uniref:Phosphohydrolase n=1 Tax=Crenobacter luteus TaxID=1452487 RepID=A0A163DL84_9NEIS|nr:HD domain-containing phosphohydrolase [Crenobacter luteus]KZE34901.1 phosphohydrolase [Crenobacter luteus]TCP12159.1 HD domain-containing protein [Crenobacter luteus]
MSETRNTAKLPPLLVRVGQELQVDVYAKNGILLLKKGHYVLSPEQRDKLLTVGTGDADEVEARLEREKRERAAAQREAEEAARPKNPLVELDFLTRRVRGLLNHALAVRGFADAIRDVADGLASLAERSPDGLIAACLLVPFADYGSAHSLHSAALLAVLGRRLGLEPAEYKALLCAALTMNVSVTLLHNQLAQQGESLSDEQREAMFAHPLLSSAILREAGVDDARWHELVQQHHEDADGSGYPMGLAAAEIHPHAQLLRLVDVLAALLVGNAQRPGQLPSAALARLFKGEFGAFDPTYVALLIKELGVYPPGSFVKLASNEIAVVTQRGDKANTPRVAALRKVDGPPYAEPLPRDARNPQHKIVEAASLSAAGVRPAFLVRLWK